PLPAPPLSLFSTVRAAASPRRVALLHAHPPGSTFRPCVLQHRLGVLPCCTHTPQVRPFDRAFCSTASASCPAARPPRWSRAQSVAEPFDRACCSIASACCPAPRTPRS